MLSNHILNDIKTLLHGNYKDRSSTEFLDLLNTLHIEYVKDPTVVEGQLFRVHNEAKDIKTRL